MCSESESESESESDSDTKTEVVGGFVKFWDAYPRKVGRADAEKKFKAALSKTTLEVILRAIEIQKISPQWMKDGGQYIPHPATWLNQGRWEDKMKIKITNESVGGRF